MFFSSSLLTLFVHNFRELRVWKKSIQLSTEIYSALSNLPNDEKYGLLPQMKRAAISIPSNIAEGAGRNSAKEFKHFLSISLGSCFELETQFIVATNLKLLEKESVQVLITDLIEIQKMIYALQKSIRT